MRPIIFSSARLDFCAWEARDFEAALALWGDPAVARFIGGAFSAEQVHHRLAREIESLATNGIQSWPFFLRATGQHVGCCGLRNDSRNPAVPELGFHLRPEHWGTGLATEAARATISRAFEVHGFRRLVAGHHPENRASRRLLAKLGFVWDRDELYLPTGLLHPTYFLDAPAERA